MVRLRVDTGAHADDSRFHGLVDELSAASEEFDRLWRMHPIPERIDQKLRLDHPEVGAVTLHLERLSILDTPGQMIYLAHTPPGSDDRAAFDRRSELDRDPPDVARSPG